jgi:hypothetical protein
MDAASIGADEVVSALKLHNWYALLAFALMAFTQIVRKHPLTSPWWQKIPDGWRFLPGVIASFAVGFTTAFLAHASFLSALIAGVGGVAGIAVPAMGLAAGLKESPLKWDGGAGGKAVMLALFMLVTPAFATSCARPAVSATVQNSEQMAYNAGVVALELVDDYEAGKIQALEQRTPPPTQAELDAAQAVVDRLKRVRDALSLARDAILNGKDASALLHDALALTVDLVTEAKADGLTLPAAVLDAVTAAQKIFGAAG